MASRELLVLSLNASGAGNFFFSLENYALVEVKTNGNITPGKMLPNKLQIIRNKFSESMLNRINSEIRSRDVIADCLNGPARTNVKILLKGT